MAVCGAFETMRERRMREVILCMRMQNLKDILGRLSLIYTTVDACTSLSWWLASNLKSYS